jgi:hypothetical protein
LGIDLITTAGVGGTMVIGFLPIMHFSGFAGSHERFGRERSPPNYLQHGQINSDFRAI